MNRLMLAFAFAMIGLASATSLAQTITRRAVPGEMALADAKKLLAEVYKNELSAAKTSALKQQLAGKLLRDAETSKEDATSQYVCFEAAKTLAIGVGDANLAASAAARQADYFEIDSLSAQVEAVRKAAPNVKLDEGHYFLGQVIEQLVPQLAKARRWKEVDEFGALAISSARKSKDIDLVKFWTANMNTLTAQAKEQPTLASALATLEEDATEGSANEVAGSLLCFTFDDWRKGLPMLALSNDRPLQELAEKELKAASINDRVAVADLWYDLATKKTDPAKKAVQRHALESYLAVEGQLAALPKARVQQRIAELYDAAMPDRIALATLTPAEYRVHAPEKGPFFVAEVAQHRFPNSLWAHSPNASGASVVVFYLPCEFKYIKGMYAFHGNEVKPRTAVQFRANGNDHEIFRAAERFAKPGTLVPFVINLKGMRRLELIVDCPGDHHDSATAWISPVLQK